MWISPEYFIDTKEKHSPLKPVSEQNLPGLMMSDPHAQEGICRGNGQMTK